MSRAKILVIPGSNRKDSCNARLGRTITNALQSMDIATTLISLRDYPLPIYDGDEEESDGVPQKAIELSNLISEHQGVVLVSPEYNSSISPLLKNALDWLSRDVGDSNPYMNRVFALTSCSPGAMGGIRGLMHLRDTLLNSGVGIITPQLCVGSANKSFDDSDNLTEPRHQKLLEILCQTLIKQSNYCLEEN